MLISGVKELAPSPMGVSLLGILLDRGINSYYPPWLRSRRKKVADYFGIFETDFGLSFLEIFFLVDISKLHGWNSLSGIASQRMFCLYNYAENWSRTKKYYCIINLFLFLKDQEATDAEVSFSLG